MPADCSFQFRQGRDGQSLGKRLIFRRDTSRDLLEDGLVKSHAASVAPQRNGEVIHKTCWGIYRVAIAALRWVQVIDYLCKLLMYLRIGHAFMVDWCRNKVF